MAQLTGLGIKQGIGMLVHLELMGVPTGALEDDLALLGSRTTNLGLKSCCQCFGRCCREALVWNKAPPQTVRSQNADLTGPTQAWAFETTQ